ncbi:MAG: protein-export chaperone SecB [Rickettsiales bacterium]
MTETKKEPSNNKAQPNVTINSQYVKDLSFENPGAPLSLTKIKTPPKIDLGLDIKVKNISENNYEVTLLINAKALLEEESLFVVELEYAGLFTVENIADENQKEQILLIYCPNLLFPFARSIIADATRDGGFQPLMVNPVDFGALYMSQKGTKTN